MVRLPLSFVLDALRNGMTLVLAFVITNSPNLQLSRYSTAFTFAIEASLYPIGFGYRGFVYLPALSRFESVKLSIPSSVSAPVSPLSTTVDTQMDRLDCSSTPTDAYTVIFTQYEYATVTVTETTTSTTTAFLISSTSAKALSVSVVHEV